MEGHAGCEGVGRGGTRDSASCSLRIHNLPQEVRNGAGSCAENSQLRIRANRLVGSLATSVATVAEVIVASWSMRCLGSRVKCVGIRVHTGNAAAGSTRKHKFRLDDSRQKYAGRRTMIVLAGTAEKS